MLIRTFVQNLVFSNEECRVATTITNLICYEIYEYNTMVTLGIVNAMEIVTHERFRKKKLTEDSVIRVLFYFTLYPGLRRSGEADLFEGLAACPWMTADIRYP